MTTNLHTYAVTVVRTETKTSVITVNVDAESPEDARVLVKYQDIPSYQWSLDAEVTKEDRVTINGARLLDAAVEVSA